MTHTHVSEQEIRPSILERKGCPLHYWLTGKQDRPLVVFDTETTGTNPRSDRIVEIACVKIHPDGRRETWVKRINPGMAIPAGSTAIHGIRDADVESLPRFAEVAGELAAFLEGCDLAGYNITSRIPLWASSGAL